MNISKKVSAFLAALGMILAGLVTGFLSPASAATTPITSFTNNASLTVAAGEGVDISNRSLSAIPLGYYTSAVPKDGVDNTLESVTVKQADAATDAKIRDALVAANLVKNDSGTYSANITCSAPFDTNNYAGWVAGCLHNSTTTPWAGQLRNFVTQLAPKLSGGTALSPVAGATNKQSVSNLTPGIYLVLDKTTTEGVTPSIPMLASTGVGTYNKLGNQDLGSVEYKAIDKPDYDKNILEDGNNTPADYTDDTKKKHNQVRIGETVTYELTATVPPTAGYSSFWLELADTLSKGLTYGEIKSVKAGSTALTADTDYKVIGTGTDGAIAPAAEAGTTSFRILFAPKADTTETSGFASDLLQSTDIAAKFEAGTKITVVYTATLNGDAVIESTGNPNQVKMVYSNNPSDSTKKKTTPPVETRTYTGQFSVCKKDMAGTALTGAKFSLSAGSTAINLVNVSDGKYRPASTTDGENTTTVTEADVNTTTGCLEFVGLKSGDYTLKETVAPSGFSSTLMPTVTFTLTVTQPDDDDDLSKAYSSLTEKSGDSNKLVDLAAERDVEVTPEISNGTEVAHEAVTTKVQDQAVVKNVHNITELPKTGAAWLGIFAGGAVLFAALGGALMYMGRRHTNS